MASNKYGEPSKIRNTEKINKVIDILLEDLPEIIPATSSDKERNERNIRAFYDHIAHAQYVEWSERGNDLRFIWNHVNTETAGYILAGRVSFITGKGWGNLTEDKLWEINRRLTHEVGDIK